MFNQGTKQRPRPGQEDGARDFLRLLLLLLLLVLLFLVL